MFSDLEKRLRARRYYLAWVDLRLRVATGAEADEGARQALATWAHPSSTLK